MRSVSKKYDLKISIFSVYYIDIDPKYVDVEAHNLDEAIKKAYEENDIDSISTVEPVLINGESIDYALCEIPDKSIY